MSTRMSSKTDEMLDRFRGFWSGTGPRRMLTVLTWPDYRQNPDESAMLDGAERCIRHNLEHAENWLPTFVPDFGTPSLPAMWGGKIIPAPPGGGIHIEPIAQSIADLERLPEPCSYEASDFARAERMYRELCRRLGSEELFVRTPDIQGPVNTLALLMEQTELALAFYDAPELIHRVLGQITDVIIDRIAEYRRRIGPERVTGNVWPFVTMPDGVGIGITQDYMPLLSPELYAEFELPLLNRIADAFGGVMIHCCGTYSQHLPTLARADFTIWGLEMHYPCTKLWDVHAVLGDRMAYVPYIAPTGLSEFPSIMDFLPALEQHGCGDARVWLPMTANDATAKVRDWVGTSRR